MLIRWEERRLPKIRPFFKLKVEAVTQKLLARFSKCHLSPNILTTMGLLISGYGAWSITRGKHLLAGGVIFLTGLFDLFDGALARTNNSSNSFGAFYDSTADRLSEALIYLGIIGYYLRQGDSRAIILGYLTLVGSYMVSYTRARAEGLGYRCEVGWMTRPERIIILALGLFIHQLKIILWVLVVLTNITALQRIYYMWKISRRKKRGSIIEKGIFQKTEDRDEILYAVKIPKIVTLERRKGNGKNSSGHHRGR